MGRITLLTGGARSGKSTRALALCEKYEKKVFVATAQAFDDEMTRRIEIHKAEREKAWTTIECPVDLEVAVQTAAAKGEVVLVDCLTVWVANLMHHLDSDELVDEKIARFLAAVTTLDSDLVFVTNEVGLGIVPAVAATRRYRDLLGSLNRRMAELAGRVELIVCGVPLAIKDESNTNKLDI